MTLADKIQTLVQEREQRDKAIEARAKLQNFTRIVKETDQILQDINDSGSFDTIDIEVKQALLAGWDVVKDTKTTLENSTIVELLGE